MKSQTYIRLLAASSWFGRGGNAHNIDIPVLTKKWDNINEHGSNIHESRVFSIDLTNINHGFCLFNLRNELV